jgi:hypothetical protein
VQTEVLAVQTVVAVEVQPAIFILLAVLVVQV